MRSMTALFWTAAILLAAALIPIGAGAQPLAVEYTLTFEATWSAETHPDGFPGFPHFSPLIGGTHDGTVHFWREGELASLGIKRMAEWGSIAPLDEEVGAAITAGSAGEVITSPPPFINSPGAETVTFTATWDHPLVTVVSMIAPSPDWFVGTESLSLLQGGAWVDTLKVELFCFDAGTDSGPLYASPDQPTVPPVPVAAITTGPLASPVPVGTFTFVRQGAVADVPAAVAGELRAHPNPFNPRTTAIFTVAQAGPAELAVFDLRGRKVTVLAEGNFEPGAHRAEWDGRDTAGRIQPAGQYLLRLAGRDGARTLKVTLAK